MHTCIQSVKAQTRQSILNGAFATYVSMEGSDPKIDIALNALYM